MAKSSLCVVFYVLEGTPRIRTFPNAVVMDRWVRKFKRENDPDSEHTYLQMACTNTDTVHSFMRDVRPIPWGER